MFELVIIGFFFCGQFLKVAVGSISVLKYLSHCTSNSIMADKFEKKINIHMYGHDRSNYYYHVHWKKSRTVHLFSLIARLKKYWLHYRLIFFRSSACPTNQLKKREREWFFRWNYACIKRILTCYTNGGFSILLFHLLIKEITSNFYF